MARSPRGGWPTGWWAAGGAAVLVTSLLAGAPPVTAGPVAPAEQERVTGAVAPTPTAPVVRYRVVGPSVPTPMATAWLTRDGTDQYRVASDRTTTRVVAGRGNVGSDSRMVLWPRAVAPLTDGEVCATWTGRTGALTQQGLALRVARAGDRVRALTVTQNVWVNPFAFNLHAWDTGRPGAPQQTLAQLDMRATFFAALPPLPWRLCARAVGATFAFKVWSAAEAEPAWGDPGHGGSAVVPPDLRGPGRSGWYAGHLGPGDHADVTALGVWSHEPPPAHLFRDLAIPPS